MEVEEERAAVQAPSTSGTHTWQRTCVSHGYSTPPRSFPSALSKHHPQAERQCPAACKSQTSNCTFWLHRWRLRFFTVSASWTAACYPSAVRCDPAQQEKQGGVNVIGAVQKLQRTAEWQERQHTALTGRSAHPSCQWWPPGTQVNAVAGPKGPRTSNQSPS